MIRTLCRCLLLLLLCAPPTLLAGGIALFTSPPANGGIYFTDTFVNTFGRSRMQ